jgi:hypothetical protein
MSLHSKEGKIIHELRQYQRAAGPSLDRRYLYRKACPYFLALIGLVIPSFFLYLYLSAYQVDHWMDEYIRFFIAIPVVLVLLATFFCLIALIIIILDFAIRKMKIENIAERRNNNASSCNKQINWV